MDPDGSNLITLHNLNVESAPRFSPNGRKIVYEDCKRACYPYALIYIIDADGSNAHLIQDPSVRGAGASFTPDGHIVFTKLRLVRLAGAFRDFGDGQICVMNDDGTNERCLTRGPAQNMYSPFGVHF